MGNSSEGQKVEKIPIDPKRIRTFSLFFKRYMSVSAMVTAALPIPITALKLIPTYAVHTKILSAYTSLFCFLILAFVFFSRHRLAPYFFPTINRKDFSIKGRRVFNHRVFIVRLLPLLLILSSLGCLLAYHYTLERDIHSGFDSDTLNTTETKVRKEILEESEPGVVFSILLIGLYLGIFITAEAAFVLMAIKEYLQDVLNLTDIQLIIPKY